MNWVVLLASLASALVVLIAIYFETCKYLEIDSVSLIQALRKQKKNK